MSPQHMNSTPSDPVPAHIESKCLTLPLLLSSPWNIVQTMTSWEASHTQAITNFMYSQTIMFIAGLYV